MRRRRDAPDSLELLLDTLCNTFGGVLFIAMLVVMLLQTSGRGRRVDQPDPAGPETLKELGASLTALRAEVEALRSAAASQERDVDPAATREVEQLMRELEQARSRLSMASTRRDELLLDLAGKQAQIQLDEAELRQLGADLSKAREDLAQLKQAGAAEHEKRTRDVRLPVVRSTTKRPIDLIVRYGRMYVWHRYSADGTPLGPNLDEFVVVEERDDSLVVNPKPTAGLPIQDDSVFREGVAHRLSSFGPNRFYLQIVARPDSFEQFELLKRALGELGYEYALLPVGEHDPVADRGGVDRGVQ